MKIILTILLLLLSACSGGGSAGTGTVTVQGSLKTNQGQAVSAKEIKILGQTEQIVVTDAEGNFVVDVSSIEAEDGIIEIEIKDLGIVNLQTQAELESNTTIKVEIKLDPEDQLIIVNQTDVVAKIVGRCDSYFENNQIIRQSNQAPEGVNCTLKVSVFGDGKPLADIPFVLEYTGCSETGDWNLLAAGETRSAPVAGDGQLEFQFFDNSEKCTYRVIAPYQLPGVASVITKIHTFTKQDYIKAIVSE